MQPGPPTAEHEYRRDRGRSCHASQSKRRGNQPERSSREKRREGVTVHAQRLWQKKKKDRQEKKKRRRNEAKRSGRERGKKLSTPVNNGGSGCFQAAGKRNAGLCLCIYVSCTCVSSGQAIPVALNTHVYDTSTYIIIAHGKHTQQPAARSNGSKHGPLTCQRRRTAVMFHDKRCEQTTNSTRRT